VSNPTLPPLTEEAFDGSKFSAPIPQKGALPKCFHNRVTYNDQKKEVRCECGSAWGGQNVYQLYILLRQQQITTEISPK
jgi:hypothetical protein